MSEKEIIQYFQRSIYYLDRIARNNENDFGLLAEKTEGMIHINNPSDFQLEFMNPFLSNFFDRNLEEVRKEDVNFLATRLHPETTEKVIPYFVSFYQKNDLQATCSAIQKSRPTAKHNYINLLSFTKILNSNNQFVTLSIPFSKLGEVGNYLKKEIEEELFLKNHFERFQSLTKQEKLILKLLSQGHSNTQIGELLFISKNTVRTHRNSIYKKMEIKNIAQTIKFKIFFNEV